MTYKLTGDALRLSTIYEVSKILAAGTNLEITLPSVINVLDNFLDMSKGIIYLYNFDTKQINPFVSRGIDFNLNKPLLKIKEYSESVFKSGSPIVIHDISTLPELINELSHRNVSEERSSYICLPLKAYRKVYGSMSLVIANTNYPFLFQDAIKLLEMVASLIAQSIELSYKIKEEKDKLKKEKFLLQNELKSKYHLKNMIGQSRSMQHVFKNVNTVAKSNATVLIRGESGTGKELIAKAIHYNSDRASKPFITLNCTSLPETLLETELFGHEKGSYTGATSERKGRFELANEGTIFLDEIGDIPITTQVKLLRVLQERKFERLGGFSTISVDIRVVAATNRNLEELTQKGFFREDLYYRLNVVPIFLPSLKDRKEDLPLLIDHFTAKFNSENDKEVELSQETFVCLINYNWPGNVRELENTLQRLVIFADDNYADINILPHEIKFYKESRSNGLDSNKINSAIQSSLTNSVEDMEKEKIIDALKKCGSVKSRTAKRLGITARQLDYRIKKYSIQIEKF
ncbi:MAG: sigma-54 interaction domain-containing protein [Thermodesulfobacteriota bacterium]